MVVFSGKFMLMEQLRPGLKVSFINMCVPIFDLTICGSKSTNVARVGLKSQERFIF